MFFFPHYISLPLLFPLSLTSNILKQGPMLKTRAGEGAAWRVGYRDSRQDVKLTAESKNGYMTCLKGSEIFTGHVKMFA